MQLPEAIRSSFLATGLSDEECKELIDLAEEIAPSGNDLLLQEFEEANDIYILLSGNVRVLTSEGDLITRLKPGAIIGEMALFLPGTRTASVESDGESRLAKISGEALKKAIEQNPAMGVKILGNIGRTLCERLRSTNLQLSAVLAAL